jgi:hypothetical protein
MNGVSANTNGYLNIRGITIMDKYFSYDKSMHKKDIKSQINLIVELHKTLIGCNFNELSRIKSTIGKEVELYKVQIKKLQNHYDDIVNKPFTNEVEKVILQNGKVMLKKANEALNYIYEHDYFGVIKRSMNREEICIGKVDSSNLRRKEGQLEIGIIKGISYNLVEEDLYSYIKKLQRKQVNIDEEELIKLFVHGSHLSFNSFNYLRGLCSYPKDFLRLWEKYMNSKRKSINEINMKKINPIYNEADILNVKYRHKNKDKTSEQIALGLEKSLLYESKSFI